MKFKVLYYKSQFGDKHLIDNAISIYTKLFNWRTKNYSHIELWLPDEKGQFWLPCEEPPEMRLKPLGTSFTSTMGQTGGRQGKGGTCLRPAYDILKNPHRWDYQDVECTDGQYSGSETHRSGDKISKR